MTPDIEYCYSRGLRDSKMSKHTIASVPLALLALLLAVPAQAYIGPGLGAGTVGVILGLVGSVLIAVFAFFWYPIKRTVKKWTASGEDAAEEEGEPEGGLEIAEEKK